MRPRQACLGMQAEAAGLQEFLGAASMRPRQACLGMLSSNENAKRVRSGFNEAEASLPRNALPSRSEIIVGPPRFNEAEASLPRNAGDVRYFATIRALASMRPRQACLGMHEQHVPAGCRAPRFNEAEASLPRNARHSPHCGKQRNPTGFNEAEASLPRNARHPPHEPFHAKHRFNEAEASLPRNALLGEVPHVHVGTASMRPRQACLGMRFVSVSI